MLKKAWQAIGISLFWLSWPVLWIYLKKTTRTRILITTADDQVLLVKGWLGTGKWSLPGGGLHLHASEAARQGVIREAREETGIELPLAAVTFLGKEMIYEYGLHCQGLIFRAILPEPVAVRPQKGEIVAIKWCPISTLADLSPSTKALCDKWL